MQLRDYQQRDLERIRASVRAEIRRVLYKLATGGGKTVMVSNMAEKTALSGKRFAFVVHRRELVKQASDTFDLCDIPHGIIAPNMTETDDLVQVVSLDAMAARIKRGNKFQFDVIAWDEAHHCAATKWVNLSNNIGHEKTIHVGLTATPERVDGKGLDCMFDTLILGPETKELIDRGYLCQFDHFAPPSLLDVSRVRTVDGDYSQPQLRDLVDNPAIIGDAVEHYKTIATGRRAIAFCAGIEHAAHTAELFRSAGISATHIDGTDTAHRVKALADFAAGKVQIITNCDIVSEGFDVPAMEAVIMLRPTQSLALYLQQAGRALRKDPKNPDKRALILDHAGNIHRHGLVDEVREWSLEGRKKRSKDDGIYVPPVRQCPKCFMVHKPAPKCIHCGHEYDPESYMPEHLAGTLEKVDVAAVQAKLKNHKQMIEVAQCTTYGEVQAIGAARGYSPRWAAHRWKHHQNNPANKPAPDTRQKELTL